MSLSFPMEVESKYRIDDEASFRKELEAIGAVYLHSENHRDTYLRHPARNFRETDEALRIREIDDLAFVTYKGPRHAGPIKIRTEIELPLASQTAEDWLRIWRALGFTVAQTVQKRREVYELRPTTTSNPILSQLSRSITVVLDRVEALGQFAEIERVVLAEPDLEVAQQEISTTAEVLRLKTIERRSYLGMLLEKLQLESKEPSA